MTEQHKPHPIALDSLFFVRSSVIAVPEHQPNGELIQVGPDNNLSVRKVDGKDRQYECSMRTVMNPDSDSAYPYMIDMECIAYLNVDDSLTDDEANRGVHITAHSVLYGAIREAVAWITSRQPYGQLMLGLSVLQPKVASASSELASPQE